MVEFKELYISPDSDYVIIDIQVPDTYHKNVGISKIIIDNQDTYSVSGSDDINVWNYEVNRGWNGTNYIINDDDFTPEQQAVIETADNNDQLLKHIRFTINNRDIAANLNKDILFIYVYTMGMPDADCPCGMDNDMSRGVLCNTKPSYRLAMNYIQELNNTCNIPVNFIDYILRFKALQLALQNGDFNNAITYWKMLYNITSTNLPEQTSNCNCRGSIKPIQDHMEVLK